ncbi:hypothetical protein [Maribacter aestuarii]|uniref:hypothetical protein n=1 Tax=Maribacter aestuarii TaxID=1130723 RepID=UPI00248B851F|nr:hypothetical protein [Maribacter aestuarii]
MTYLRIPYSYYLLVLFFALFASCQKDDIVLQEDFVVVLDEEIQEKSDTDGETDASIESYHNWVFKMQQSSGLLESVENTDFVSLYDNALAAILFIQEDNPVRAERIFDFYDGKKEDELIKNGGFYQSRNAKGEEGERTWMGDNAWLLIALNHYEAKYQSTKYIVLANALEDWLRSMQDEDGGVRGGINSDGSEIPKVTEGMLMAFNAVKGFDDFHSGILRFLETQRWDNTLGILMAWPENPEYAYAMDLHPLSSGVFSDMPDDVLFQANRYLNSQENTITGEEISGYCFDDDKDVVWLEGTAQMAVAFSSIGRFDLSDQLMLDLEKTFIDSSTINEAKGIPYTTNHGTTYGHNLLWDHADIAPALSSTIWYSFAKASFNPLHLGRKSNIPEEEKFWSLNL